MWNNLLIEYRMDAENMPMPVSVPHKYAMLIKNDVEKLNDTFNNRTDTAEGTRLFIENINTNIDKLKEYLENQLKLTSNKYKYLNKNRASLQGNINKLKAIEVAASNLSNSINKLSKLPSNTSIASKNLFIIMKSNIESIKQDKVEALIDTTKGFTEIVSHPNGNGTVTTTIFREEQEPSIVNEGYLGRFNPPHPPRSPIIFDSRGNESIKRSQKKMQRIQQQNTTGGRRSRHRRTRRNCKKTRRVTKHRRSHRGTRRV